MRHRLFIVKTSGLLVSLLIRVYWGGFFLGPHHSPMEPAIIPGASPDPLTAETVPPAFNVAPVGVGSGVALGGLLPTTPLETRSGEEEGTGKGRLRAGGLEEGISVEDKESVGDVAELGDGEVVVNGGAVVGVVVVNSGAVVGVVIVNSGAVVEVVIVNSGAVVGVVVAALDGDVAARVVEVDNVVGVFIPAGTGTIIAPRFGTVPFTAFCAGGGGITGRVVGAGSPAAGGDEDFGASDGALDFSEPEDEEDEDELSPLESEDSDPSPPG